MASHHTHHNPIRVFYQGDSLMADCIGLHWELGEIAMGGGILLDTWVVLREREKSESLY